MEITLKGEKAITITDERAESSCGIPVAIIDGIAYGKTDAFPKDENSSLPWLRESVGQRVAELNTRLYLNEDGQEFVRKFYR